MKVYSSDINTDVCGSHLLKVIGASDNVCVDCIVHPLGGNKSLLNNVFAIESFIQEIRSKTLIHPVMKQVKYLWSYWIIHSRDSFKNADSSSNETSQVFMKLLNHSFKPIFI